MCFPAVAGGEGREEGRPRLTRDTYISEPNVNTPRAERLRSGVVHSSKRPFSPHFYDLAAPKAIKAFLSNFSYSVS